MLSIEMPFPSLFSFQECLWFLDRNYDECLHSIQDQVLWKCLEIRGQKRLLKIFAQDQTLHVVVREGLHSEVSAIEDYLKIWFDWERNLAPFYELLQKDADLAFMAKAYRGLRLVAIPDLFEALCWSVIGQQINLTFAYKLKRRLVENFGESVSFDQKPFYLFPSPARIATLKPEDLRPFQFSGRKAEYIIGIAQAFETRKIVPSVLRQEVDAEAIFQQLTALRGVGEWTARYAMMKSLDIKTSVPYGDVGLYNALHQVKGFDKRPPREQLEALFAQFPGWESYLVFYLWRSLA